MGLLDDQLAIDAAGFVDTDGFAETVTFYPKSGGSRSINVVVNRYAAIPDSGPGGIPTIIEVFIRNHATLGVTTINTGGDKIDIAERLGGTVYKMYVSDVLASDSGMFKIRARKQN